LGTCKKSVPVPLFVFRHLYISPVTFSAGSPSMVPAPAVSSFLPTQGMKGRGFEPNLLFLSSNSMLTRTPSKNNAWPILNRQRAIVPAGGWTMFQLEDGQGTRYSILLN
jgi:hypothetical protein